MNAGATFQREMDITFKGLIGQSVVFTLMMLQFIQRKEETTQNISSKFSSVAENIDFHLIPRNRIVLLPLARRALDNWLFYFPFRKIYTHSKTSWNSPFMLREIELREIASPAVKSFCAL
jgi:hypothetical protein